MDSWKLKHTEFVLAPVGPDTEIEFRIELFGSRNAKEIFRVSVYRKDTFRLQPSFDSTKRGDNLQSFDHSTWVFDDQFCHRTLNANSIDVALQTVLSDIAQQLGI
jgi:hypothetical protein